MSAGFILNNNWNFAQRAESRYKRIFRALVLLYIILGIIVPFIKLIGQEKGGGEEGKTRYAQMVQPHQEAPVAQKEEEPKPAEKTKETEPPKPQKPQKQEKPVIEKPVVTQQQQVQTARQVAQRSGLLAMANDLSDLRDRNLTQLDSTRASTAQAGGGEVIGDASQTFAANASSSSNGIAVNTPGSGQRYPNGTKLDSRKTTTVQSPVGFGHDTSKPGQSGNSAIPGRTNEEINAIFDRAKGAFTAIYTRAKRDNANLATEGVVTIAFTIQPDGSVTDCKLISSTLGDADVTNKIVQRASLLNFGPKGVPAFAVQRYPIRIQGS